MTGEFEFIDWIKTLASSQAGDLIGIGDDAAVLPTPGPHDLLVATDMMLDGIHFDSTCVDPALIGRKALAVNLSDIAAMGGQPQQAFVSIAIPQSNSRELARGIYRGIDALATEYKVTLAGGDTTSWPHRLAINVTVVGQVETGTALLRSRARPGDVIFVTGPLGYSLRGKHLRFTPRVREINAIRKICTPHAAIDISDGFAADLHHILVASKVAARINAEAIPIQAGGRGDDLQRQLQHALEDGEDFELLLCLDPDSADKLMVSKPPQVELFAVGNVVAESVVPGARCELVHPDGTVTRLKPGGWSHQLP